MRMFSENTMETEVMSGDILLELLIGFVFIMVGGVASLGVPPPVVPPPVVIGVSTHESWVSATALQLQSCAVL